MQLFEQLERDWAVANGLSPDGMVACSSGTAALHLALECLELPSSSEVLVPDFTMIACPRAVSLAGLSPKFVDCEENLLVCPNAYAQACTSSTRVIMVVHIYGRQCQMPEIASIASDVGLHVVEDLAEAHGVKPHPDSSAACWSFYKNKIIAGEEGGAVYFKNPRRAALARQLRSLGFTEAHDMSHIPRGHNYRMSNAHARLVLESLADYERIAERRLGVEAAYNALVPREWQMPAREAVWVYDVRIPGVDLDRVVQELNREGVAARHSFKPATSQPEYSKRNYFTTAHQMSREVLYLPVTPTMTDQDVAFNVWTLRAAVERSGSFRRQ